MAGGCSRNRDILVVPVEAVSQVFLPFTGACGGAVRGCCRLATVIAGS
jgi:hypothetical protein